MLHAAHRKPRWLTVLLVVCMCTSVCVFLPFGLVGIIRLRLDLGPGMMSGPLQFLPYGGLASLWVALRIDNRFSRAAAQLNLIGWCTGVQTGLALLAVGVASGIDAAVLSAALGITMGINVIATLACVSNVVTGNRRWLICGGVLAALALVPHAPVVAFVRPETVIGFSVLLFGLPGWLAWSRQYDAREGMIRV